VGAFYVTRCEHTRGRRRVPKPPTRIRAGHGISIQFVKEKSPVEDLPFIFEIDYGVGRKAIEN